MFLALVRGTSHVLSPGCTGVAGGRQDACLANSDAEGKRVE